MVYKPTPFDNPNVQGAPSASDAELRALIEEMKNANPGALAPPPRRPRERVPGMQKMISKVSGTKQGSKIPGLGFVKDTDVDGDVDADEQAPLAPPPTEMSIGPKALGRSFDPFSAAGKNIEPLGLSPKNIAGVTAMAAPIGIGMAGLGGGLIGAAGLGALSGAGAELFGNRDPSLGDIASSAETGALMGPLISKAMPVVGGALGRLLPKGNDAKVAAEMGAKSLPGSPFDRAGTKLTPPPRPQTEFMPGNSPTQVMPGNAPTNVMLNPSGAAGQMSRTQPGYLGPPLKAPPIPGSTQVSGPPPGMTTPGRMVPQQTQASGPPPGMTMPGNLAPRPPPPKSPGFMPDKSTLMYPPMQTGAMSNQPVNMGGAGGTVNQRVGGLAPRPPQPMQFGQEYDTLVQPRTMMGSESPSVGGMTPTPGMPRIDPTFVPQTGQTADAIPFMPTQINPTRVTPPQMGALSPDANPTQGVPGLAGILDRLRQQNPALYYALIAGAGAGYGGGAALGFNALQGAEAAPPEVPPSPYAVPRPYAVQR